MGIQNWKSFWIFMESLSQSVSQPVSQSVRQSVRQSFSRLVSKPMTSTANLRLCDFSRNLSSSYPRQSGTVEYDRETFSAPADVSIQETRLEWKGFKSLLFEEMQGFSLQELALQFFKSEAKCDVSQYQDLALYSYGFAHVDSNSGTVI